MDEPTPKPDARKPDKAQRLAEALRENLRKRKAQSRARRGGAGIGARSAQDRPDGDKAPDDARAGTGADTQTGTGAVAGAEAKTIEGSLRPQGKQKNRQE